MNVTFSIQAEFEDIPRELVYMLRYVEEELGLSASQMQNIQETITAKHENEESLINHGKAELLSLHKARLHLAKIDTRLEDCMSILGGYIDHIENPPEPEQEVSEPEGQNEEG